MLGIAGPLAARRPDAAILLLTGSMETHAYGLADNLDYVKLPAVPKRPLYEGLPARRSRGERSKLRNVMFVREAVARATIDAFAPDLVVVDHAPAGLFGELAAALAALDAAKPRPAIVFLMRDVTFGPEQTRELWRGEGAFPLLDGLYDRILVYGSRELFDPIVEYRLSAAAAAKTRFVGYLRPPAPGRTRTAVRAALGVGDRPLAVVTTGGGADGGFVVRAYLDALRAAPDLDLASYVVTGPLLPAAERDDLAGLAATLPDVTLVPFDPDLVGAIDAADLVVSMGGYNAVLETVHAAKRGIVVPRPPGPEEQLIRAERFAARGLIELVRPRDLTPDRLLGAIRAALVSSPGAPPSLPFDGRERIVDELIAVLADGPGGGGG